MPLDTSTYDFALLRIDGRRWNELRRFRVGMRTVAATDGSSFVEMGHTKVECVVAGPREATASLGPGVVVNISVAGFSGVDHKQQQRGDRRIAEMAHVLSQTFSRATLMRLLPNSVVVVALTVLSVDGGLLAALINATTLALVDAGVPMLDLVAACTSGSTGAFAAADCPSDPVLDLNRTEELELPFMTVATLGGSDKICALVCESRMQISRLEGMMVAAIDGCSQIRHMLDEEIRKHGQKMVDQGTVAAGDIIADQGPVEKPT